MVLDSVRHLDLLSVLWLKAVPTHCTKQNPLGLRLSKKRRQVPQLQARTTPQAKLGYPRPTLAMKPELSPLCSKSFSRKQETETRSGFQSAFFSLHSTSRTAFVLLWHHPLFKNTYKSCYFFPWYSTHIQPIPAICETVHKAACFL